MYLILVPVGCLFLLSVLFVFYTFKNHIHPIFFSSVLPWLTQVLLSVGKGVLDHFKDMLGKEPGHKNL